MGVEGGSCWAAVEADAVSRDGEKMDNINGKKVQKPDSLFWKAKVLKF